jgi:hypothetical protein
VERLIKPVVRSKGNCKIVVILEQEGRALDTDLQGEGPHDLQLRQGAPPVPLCVVDERHLRTDIPHKPKIAALARSRDFRRLTVKLKSGLVIAGVVEVCTDCCK